MVPQSSTELVRACTSIKDSAFARQRRQFSPVGALTYRDRKDRDRQQQVHAVADDPQSHLRARRAKLVTRGVPWTPQIVPCITKLLSRSGDGACKQVQDEPHAI